MKKSDRRKDLTKENGQEGGKSGLGDDGSMEWGLHGPLYVHRSWPGWVRITGSMFPRQAELVLVLAPALRVDEIAPPHQHCSSP